jgi:hypothetical protein
MARSHVLAFDPLARSRRNGRDCDAIWSIKRAGGVGIGGWTMGGGHSVSGDVIYLYIQVSCCVLWTRARTMTIDATAFRVTSVAAARVGDLALNRHTCNPAHADHMTRALVHKKHRPSHDFTGWSIYYPPRVVLFAYNCAWSACNFAWFAHNCAKTRRSTCPH